MYHSFSNLHIIRQQLNEKFYTYNSDCCSKITLDEELNLKKESYNFFTATLGETKKYFPEKEIE